MNLIRKVTGVLVLATLLPVCSASAETILWTGIDYDGDYLLGVDVMVSYPPDDPWLLYDGFGAGTLHLTIDGGDPVVAYCFDVFNDLYYGDDPENPVAYNATITRLPVTPPYGDMAILIDRNPVAPRQLIRAAAVQTAIWKLRHGNESTVQVYPGTQNDAAETDDLRVEEMAADFLTSAPTYREVSIFAAPHSGSPGVVDVVVTGTPGLPVVLSTTQGAFATPPEGEGVVDGEGRFLGHMSETGACSASINLGTEKPALTVTAEVQFPVLWVIEAIQASLKAQDLVIVRHETTTVETTYDGPAAPVTAANETWMLYR